MNEFSFLDELASQKLLFSKMRGAKSVQMYSFVIPSNRRGDRARKARLPCGTTMLGRSNPCANCSGHRGLRSDETVR